MYQSGAGGSGNAIQRRPPSSVIRTLAQPSQPNPPRIHPRLVETKLTAAGSNPAGLVLDHAEANAQRATAATSERGTTNANDRGVRFQIR